MPRPILLTWELGGGRGHILKLGTLARSLKHRGLRPVFAIQRLYLLEAIRADCDGADVYQAPLWPGLLPGAAHQTHRNRVSMGDTLGDLGLLRASAAEYMLRAWDQLFALIKPSVIVADFAPASLLAARGRIPTVAYGNGYTLPPASADRFAMLTDESDVPKHDEAKIIAAVNEALETMQRPAIDRLPAVFAADRSCVACYAELDPFAALRERENDAPFLTEWPRETPGRGNEIFGYFAEHIGSYPSVLASLENVARAGIPTRIYIPDLDPAVAKSLAEAGAIVEPAPVPFEQIAARSALILSHGGLGIVSSALAAGIPHVVIPLDLEKRLTGRALVRLGLGRCLEIKGNNPLEASLLSAAIQEAYADEQLRKAAKAAAPNFAARLVRPPGETVADLVEELG